MNQNEVNFYIVEFRQQLTNILNLGKLSCASQSNRESHFPLFTSFFALSFYSHSFFHASRRRVKIVTSSSIISVIIQNLWNRRMKSKS